MNFKAERRSSHSPLEYHYEEQRSDSYRTWKHLIMMNIPQTIVKNVIKENMENSPNWAYHDEPICKTLYHLEECYFKHDLRGVYKDTYPDGTSFQCIRIHNNKIKNSSDWINLNIPVINFRPTMYNDITLKEGMDYLPEIDKDGLDAEYVICENGIFSAIYGHNDLNKIKVTWKSPKAEPRDPGPIQLEYITESLINLRGVIWKNKQKIHE